jgi:hypothetical protein
VSSLVSSWRAFDKPDGILADAESTCPPLHCSTLERCCNA